MTNVKRIYVEKKEGLNIEAEHLFLDLKDNLEIETLEKLRILNCYDVEGVEDNEFEICKTTILSELPVDNVYEEKIEYSDNDFIFAVEYLPGQFNQRADSAMQSIQIITKNERVLVESSKVYILSGKLTTEEKDRIKKYCINPVDSIEISLEKPKTLKMQITKPEDIKNIEGFINKSKDELLEMKQDLGFAMSDEDFVFCQDYFKNTEKRNPTVTEMRVIDTYWSDHCRHTTFLTKLNDIKFKEGRYKEIIEDSYNSYLNERANVYGAKINDRDISLMDIAVMGMKALKKKGMLNDLDESEEINACSIEVDIDVDGKDEKWLIMFKNETHNHPTEIEPFGGASTCLGGAIRDPLSGRSYVYQAMRVTGSGNPLTKIKDTLPNKLPQRKITQQAAAGYSSYGNQIGLAGGLVNEIYDEGYVAKRMEIGALVGAAKKENVVRERPEKGDVVVLVGGRTGRDGCGGATGSSKEHTEESISTCSAEVQKGNPPMERKLQRLFRNPKAAKMIKRCNDFGAGGVSVAIGELADGLDINLDMVLTKYDGMDGTELAISESQERMAVVVDQKDADSFIAMSLEENLEAVVVANVTDDRRLTIYWKGKDIVNISRDFLDTNGVKQSADVIIKTDTILDKSVMKISNIKQSWIENLKQLNVAAQKGLSERFDSTVGAGTVLMPFGGKHQLTPSEAMVAKVPVGNGETETVTIMSYGYNPIVSKQSPFHGGVLAVVESISRIVAVGGNYEKIRLTFQEYFESLGENPEKWGIPMSSLLGAFHAQMNLDIPSIGGKDSMSGTYNDLTVPPTLVSFSINLAKIKDIISNEFKKAGTILLELNTIYDSNDLPDFESLKQNYSFIYKLIQEGKIISANSIGIGGIAAVISKMGFGNMIGADITYKNESELFVEKYGSFVLEIDCTEAQVAEFFETSNYKVLGKTIAKEQFIVNNTEISMDEALESWLSTLESVFPIQSIKPANENDITLKQYSKQIKKSANIKIAKPRVFIPLFPGTNGEYETIKHFEKAGAIVETFILKNLSTALLDESIKQISDKISNSQIICIPGGASAGNEPDGGGKFIAAVFRNKHINEALMDMINNKDGLMLGISNGFQALIKLGLIPYGKIISQKTDSPTLTYNTIGRHVSTMGRTKVISKLSPWMRNVELNDIHTVVLSSEEGRFVANEDTIRQLEANGQIATQYVDFDEKASNDITFNPYESTFAIESLTSPDGRILGKMGHCERTGNGLYKNIDGNKEQYIFKSGVDYFM